MAKAIKPRSEVEEKMKDRVSTSGKYLKSGMARADDPLDILSQDVDGYADKMQKGVNEAVRTGRWQAGIKKAKDQNKWQKSHDRAATNYEARAGDMVENAMAGYDERAKDIKEAQDFIDKMPSTTTDQRIARSSAYQKKLHELTVKRRGLKA